MIAMKDKGPLLPDVRLYHSVKKALRHMRKLGIDAQAAEDAGAQAWVSGSDAIVVMSYRGKRFEEDALLVHEAVHVVRMYLSETLMEEHAGEEIYAYATQAVAGQLMRAHRKWRRRRVSGH